MSVAYVNSAAPWGGGGSGGSATCATYTPANIANTLVLVAFDGTGSGGATVGSSKTGMTGRTYRHRVGVSAAICDRSPG